MGPLAPPPQRGLTQDRGGTYLRPWQETFGPGRGPCYERCDGPHNPPGMSDSPVAAGMIPDAGRMPREKTMR